jgi:uncharacterized protein YijF (DUF1287 family)
MIEILRYSGSLLLFLLFVFSGACAPAAPPVVPLVATTSVATESVPQTFPAKIVEGARKQIGDRYVADYQTIPYPNGDVPAGQGACTDVVIRAFRHAGVDLQQWVHEDMKKHFAAYPKKWGLRHTDTSIDHRRVPNLQTFFHRHHAELPLNSDWSSGDVVTWKLDSGLDHCGIVSDRKTAQGVPLVIHNLGQCAEEDVLHRWKITGHFRVTP